MSKLSEPDQVGPYRLLRQLGAGGMGEVFLAHDDRLDRRVAIKHAHARLASPEQRARFRREAWAAARLAHPAIVSVFDVVSDERGDWIVMEHVDGPTLRETLSAHGRPPLATALSWAAQIADGLVAAHQKGIIHRDLKVENVMVAASGHLKIVDFGLAKPLSEEPAGLAVSATGAVLGTLRSMAPEQARGHQVDARADLFSLGVLLYELLTGVPPFAGDDPVDVLTRLASLPHTPVTDHEPGIPPRLVTLVDALLAKAPEARPGSAAEVAETLHTLALEIGPAHRRSTGAGPQGVAVEEVPTEEGSPGGPVREPPRRSRFWLGMAALVAVVVAIWLLPRWIAREPAATPVASTEEPERLLQAGMAQLERWDQQGHVDTAIDLFQRALLVDPRSAPVQAGLARAYWRKSRVAGRDMQFLQQARAVAEQAVALDDRLAAAHLSLGLSAVDLGDLATAETALARAESLAPDDPVAAQGRGNLALARGDLDAAESAYREALARGESAELHNALGALMFRLKRYDEAERAFRRAIVLRPDSIFGYRNLAGVLQLRGDSAGATEQLQRAIEIAPHTTLYTSLGTILFYQGRYAEANAAFEHAIAQGDAGTHSSMLWANLGDSYRFLPGHEKDARLAFRRAVQLASAVAESKPADVDIQSRLGLYLAKAGDAEAARRQLATLLSGAELDVTARWRAVIAYEVLGDRGEALAVLAETLRAGLPIEELEREPELSALRNDPAYHRLLAARGDG